MRYVSLDIETTGIDPESDQILQIAAVVADFQGMTYQSFDIIVDNGDIYGSPYALHLNSRILKMLADAVPEDYQHGDQGQLPRIAKVEDAIQLFQKWLYLVLQRNRIVFAGKNFDSFDKQFLKNYGLYDPCAFDLDFGHSAALDPGILWFDPMRDTQIPYTAECCRRAGIPDIVTHNAMDDAMQVVELITKYYEKIARLNDAAKPMVGISK